MIFAIFWKNLKSNKLTYLTLTFTHVGPSVNGGEMLKRLKNNVLDQDRFGNITVTNASVQGKYLLISCKN